MLTIYPIKTGLYQPIYKPNKIVHQNMTQLNTVKSPQFKGIFAFNPYTPIPEKTLSEIQKQTRPPFRESTVKQLDNVYNNYKESLNEITPEDITNAVNNLKNTTNYSEKEILYAMQKATQFGNMQSLKVIGKALNDNNIKKTGMMRYHKTNEKFNLNEVIHYFFYSKKLQRLDGEEYGVILDNNKLNNLEKMKESNPTLFDERINEIDKSFILSGFDDGITFLDRSKNLEDVTKKFLQKDIDKEAVERARKLGLEPIIIKNENEPSIQTIYNQLKPEQMTRKQLDAVIDANVMTRLNDIQEQVDTKKALAQYLENNMKIFTPEKLSQLSKNMYSEIKNVMNSENKTMDDVVYGIPKYTKSNIVVNYMYQKVNNIPDEKFISVNEFLSNKDYEDKTMVILDDCSISGEQIIEISNDINKSHKLKNNSIIYAPLYCTETAETEINADLDIRKRSDSEKLINLTKEYYDWDENIEPKNSFYTSLGEDGFEHGTSCIVFPYMSPDNNSEFAANIAFFHHINYDDYKKNIENCYIRSIKTFKNLAEKVSSITEILLNKEESHQI